MLKKSRLLLTECSGSEANVGRSKLKIMSRGLNSGVIWGEAVWDIYPTLDLYGLVKFIVPTNISTIRPLKVLPHSCDCC